MSQPDSNDEIIKVIYQAIGDYSQLMRETRRAREETRALKREVESLAGSTTHRVRVEADTRQAQNEIARVLRDLVVKVKVTVDAIAARRELAALLKDVVVKARVVVDAATARAEIARTVRDTVVKVRIATDDAGLATLSAQLGRLRDLTVRVGVSVDDAGLGRLRTALGRLRDLAVTVGVRVDDAALARLRARLAALRDLAVKVAVTIDEAAMARMSARLSQMHATVTVDVDEGGAVVKFAALIAQLQAMARVSIKVDIDDSVFRRFTVLMGQLIRLRSQLRQGGGGGDDDHGGGGDDDSDQVPRAPKLPQGLTNAAGAMLKWPALIAALIPVLGAATVGVGTLGAALLAAGGAAAIFATAAIGAFSKVSEAVKAYEKSGTIAEGPLGEMVKQVEAVKARYAEFQDATQQDVFAVFSRGLSIAVDLLDKVQDLVGRAAQGIDAAMAEVQDAINGAGFDRFLDFLGRQGPAALQGLTRGLLGFAGGLGNLLMAFEPLLHAFLDGFAQMGESFSQWAADLGSNTEFQEFIDYCVAQVPVVLDFIANLAAAGSNVVAALAPIGAVLLQAISAALAFVAAIPPGSLRIIIGALMGLAVAVKLVQAAMAVSAGFTAFRAWLNSLPASFSRAAAGANAAKIAIAGLGAALAIGAAVMVLTALMGKLAEQQQAAADATRQHNDALQQLAGGMAEGQEFGGKEQRKQQWQNLTGMTADGSAGGVLGIGAVKESASLPDVLKAAGISSDDATAGSLGLDPKKQSQNIGKLEAYRRQIAQQAEDTDSDALRAKADAIGKLIDQYEAGSFAAGELTEAEKANKQATGESGDESIKTAAKYKTQADAAAAVKKALQADFSSDENMQRYDAAVSAQQAYESAQRAAADAADQQAAAERRVREATEAVTEARKAAVQRIRDVQRALRDMALDERQANLSAKQAQERLDELLANGGDEDAIEQARIDLERAQNAKADFQQDKGQKKADLQDELDKGVEGNKQLKTAIQNQKDAQKALSAANRNMAEAADKVRETKLAFVAAAGALGIQANKLGDLKKKMDQLKSKTINVAMNTKNADEALAKLLQGQYALQLLAAHPDWGLDKAMAEAAKQVPTVAAAKKTPAPTGPDSGNMNPNVNPGRAGGGPLPPPPGYAGGGQAMTRSAVVAGAVHGPGTGTSDSILVNLPVGKGARLSRGEHITTDAEVRNAPGGHAYMEAFRAGLRAGRPWGPPAQRPGLTPGLARGGPAGWSAVLPSFRAPVPASIAMSLPPGYAAGGAATAAAAAGPGETRVDRSVVVNAVIHNPVPEPASDSMYRRVRDAVEGDEK